MTVLLENQGEEKMKTQKQKFLFRTICLGLFSLLVIPLLIACASAARAPEKISNQTFAEGVIENPPREGEVQSLPAAENPFNAGGEPAQAKRLVIKNARLTIVVNDPAKSLEVISKMADELGGFVVTANLNHTQLSSGTEVPHGSITIRIPAEKLNEALDRIEAESDQPPQDKTIESQDVTREYTDLQSRLRNLEDAEEQLRKIMDNAFNTEDVLSVYNQLVQVREQIEVIKGQIQYYDEASALSAISVELVANAAMQPLKIGGWQPVGVMKDAVQALLNALKFVVNAFIWIVIFVIPILLVIYLIFVLPLRAVIRFIRKRRPKQKTTAPAQMPPQEPLSS